ncbi:multidrug ABC transporter ATP-binding protein [Mycobacterium asiaticum]|uniref:Multidrug ABC transporter ATP-binding protein n=1 Tax=Mycobacterium asiaticum TaxID=1790 RepID=A0A1A3P8S5_MYCAS|nr:ABC transporter ATP-binding protein/permease [Mycobacterium asiaticum]OBK29714.1 multidrug ABC transporter ATP-binding protein [Mycobacterium asiaticum]
MAPTPFKPSTNWSHAFVDSLQWLATAWLISAFSLLLVLVLIRFFTPWGRQFWRISRGYFVGRDSVRVWLMLGVLLLSVLMSVRLDVLFSYQGNDLYTGVQKAVQGMAAGNAFVKQSGVRGFWTSLAIFALLAMIWIIRYLVDIYLLQRFVISWRVWLTGHLTDDWLDGRAYYRDLFIDNTIDNPDQRIQQDIDIFTANNTSGTPNSPANGTRQTLLFGAVNAVASVASFAAILWNLSGGLNVFGAEIPRAMFWTVLVYVLLTTVVAVWLGRPLITLSFNNEKLNAAFRYALVRLRDAAEAVGFYRGERVERAQLWRRFTPIIDNYRNFVRRSIIFNGWNWLMTQVIVPLPWLIQAPRLFQGQIDFGDVGQTATAFGNISDSLSFFRNQYDAFASYRAAVIRLHGLVDANDRGRALPAVLTLPSADGAVELSNVEVRKPDGDSLIDPLDIRLEPGYSLVITGQSGSGKTTLLRSLAELWPYASGSWHCPGGKNETMFLSQLPYVPLGSLPAVVCYPNAAGDVADTELHEVLRKVALAPLIPRLDEEQDWAKVLSPGEQQRVAFARILLTKPKSVFLDEATSALDPGLEYALYQLVRDELPDCIVVSVSHHPAVEQHHDRQLELLGGGEWRLGPIDKEFVASDS